MAEIKSKVVLIEEKPSSSGKTYLAFNTEKMRFSLFEEQRSLVEDIKVGDIVIATYTEGRYPKLTGVEVVKAGGTTTPVTPKNNAASSAKKETEMKAKTTTKTAKKDIAENESVAECKYAKNNMPALPDIPPQKPGEDYVFPLIPKEYIRCRKTANSDGTVTVLFDRSWRYYDLPVLKKMFPKGLEIEVDKATYINNKWTASGAITIHTYSTDVSHCGTYPPLRYSGIASDSTLENATCDALKRAASYAGLCKELYFSPTIILPGETVNGKELTVSELEYNAEGYMCSLTLSADGKPVYAWKAGE